VTVSAISLVIPVSTLQFIDVLLFLIVLFVEQTRPSMTE